MKRAFSLIEVMVSSSLLIVGLTGIVSAMSTTTAQYEHQRHISRGIHIAESAVEELLIRPVSDANLAVGTWPVTPFNYDAEGDRVLSGPGTYHVQWTVSGGPVAVPAMRTVKVTVSWTERDSPRSFSLTTIRR
ncbi:MAG: hypothetical protein Q8O67_03905 [Deltaproteobacteria bacterium]|nr:hypothetical protein [Deltaproteobacteria bacterium]